MHAGAQTYMLKCFCDAVDCFVAERKPAVWNIARFLGQYDTGKADLLILHQHALGAWYCQTAHCHQQAGYCSFTICTWQKATLELYGNTLSGPLPDSWGYMPQASQTDSLAIHKIA